MLCPNCKSELMNVNGKFVCVECGQEVSENEAVVGQSEESQIMPVINDTENITGALEQPALPPTEEIVTPSVTEGVDEIGQILEQESLDSVEAEVAVPDETTESVEMTTPPVELEDVSLENLQASTSEQPTAVDLPVEATTEVIESENEQTAKEPSIPTDTSDVGISPENVVEALTQPVEEMGQTVAVETPAEEVSQNIPINISTQPEQIVPVEEITTPAQQNVVENQEDSVEQTSTPVAEVSTEPASQSQFQEGRLIDPFEIVDPVEPVNNQIDPGLMYQENYQAVPVENTQAPSNSSLPSETKKLYILIGMGVFLLLLLIGGGVTAYFALTKSNQAPNQPVVVEEWKKYKSVDYSVEFPLTPEKSSETISIGESKIKLEKISAQKDGVTYAISSGAVPASVVTTPELLEFVNALAKANDGKVTSTESFEFEGQTASEYNINSDESYLKGRVILKEGKIYFVEYISIGDSSDNFDRFVSSFAFAMNEIED